MNPKFRKFLSYYRPYKKLLAAVLACSAIVAITALIFPLLIRVITKDIQASPTGDIAGTVVQVVLAMLALLAIQSVCSYFYDYRGHAMGAMMERDIRAELFEHYEKLSFSFHNEHKPGHLMSRLTNDLLNLAELYHHGPENLFIFGVKFIGAAVVLCLINIKLALISLAFIPVIAVFTVVVGTRMNRAVARNLQQIGDVNSLAEENLSGIHVVKSFANEAMECEKFRQENNCYFASRSAIYRAEAQVSVGISVLTQLITVAVVGFGGISIAHATLDLPDLITFLLYISYLIDPVIRLAFFIEQYQEGIAGFNRFLEMMSIQPDITDAPDAQPLEHVHGDIRFVNAAFRYQDHLTDVLTGLSLSVHAGEMVAIVGQSGVGKTTLCSLIPRFYDLTQGDITIDGHSIRSVTLDSLRRAVGVVQQDVYLFSGSVMENIRYGKPDATDQDVIHAAIHANAHEFIMALPNGYATDIGRRGIKLSGGQRQRLSIARVFLKNPPIIIFDEATSSLDNESEIKVQAALDVLAKGRTTFVIAHRLSTIRNADRIIVLSEQGVAEQGTHAELIQAKGLYARLYDAGQTAIP